MTSLLPASVKKRIPVLIALVMTTFFVILAFTRAELIDDSFLTSLERRWIDAKFQMRGEQEPGKNVVIVGIDDKTLDTLGSYRTFQRDTWATLIDQLAKLQPKAIGFDIYFSEPEVNNPENDKKFADAVARAGNVVLGVYLDLASHTANQRLSGATLTDDMINLVVEKQIFPVERRTGTEREVSHFIRGKALALNIPELTQAAASFGFVNFHPDAEGSLRHQPQFIDYQDKLYPSLDLQLLRKYLDAPSPIVDFDGERVVQVQIGNYLIPTDMYGRFMLNFNGPRGIHETISMIDVMQGRVAPETIQGKIVIVGSPAVGLNDVIPTPYDATLPGVELHANVIDNVLQQRFLHRDKALQFLDIALILIFGVVLGVYLPLMNAQRSLSYSGLLFVGFVGLNVLSFIYLRWVMSVVYPGLSLGLTAIGMIGWKYLTEERAKNQTKRTFQYYLDPNVIERVMNEPEMLKLGGDKRDLSVLFSDIRGFTSFSEKMAPAEVVQFLNLYLDRMTNLVFQHKGTLDKFIGDAVMAFWGAPLETKDHALRATLTALEMKAAVEDLRSVLVLPGGAKFEIGIGINSGPAVVGNMGSQARFNFTVMGDNVNLSSRLEGMNKYYGTTILISDTTYQQCKDMVFCRELDTIQVKGKSQAVTIYEPLGIRYLLYDHRGKERRGKPTLGKQIKRAYFSARYGERRKEDRRLGSERLMITAAQEELAAMYEHALALYRKGDFDDAEMAFDHVLSLSPGDGPSRLMKGRISKYRTESEFDPVYKFDEK